MKYTIIEARSASCLVEAVNIQIKNGWEPFGSMSVATSSDHPFFYQTMIWIEKK